MDLVQLKYFVAVAEAGHLTNAAKKLNVAQPALSVSIARLEKEVGVPLFDRVGRNISLNKFGEIYLEYAEQALDRMRKAQPAVNKYAEKLEDILSLGIISKPLAWDLLLEFKERYPNSQIRQTELSPEHMEEELQKGNVDYVISSRLTMAPGLVCEVFREDPLALAVPADPSPGQPEMDPVEGGGGRAFCLSAQRLRIPDHRGRDVPGCWFHTQRCGGVLPLSHGGGGRLWESGNSYGGKPGPGELL